MTDKTQEAAKIISRYRVCECCGNCHHANARTTYLHEIEVTCSLLGRAYVGERMVCDRWKEWGPEK